jgi:hypothetical protein
VLYIGANISWRSKILIAQLRTNLGTGKGQKKCGRKEYVFCALLEKWKQKKHFILECEALKNSRENYAGILATSSWDNLFSEEFVEKLGAVIVKLYRKRAEYKSQMEKQSVPWAIFSLVDVKNTFFLSIPQQWYDYYFTTHY